MALLTHESVDCTVSAIEDSARKTATQASVPTIEPLPASRRPEERTQEKTRWGVILAGGDGNRLRSLTRFISGDDRPKQFCKVFGRRTLFDQTRLRAARSIPGNRTILALTSAHEPFYDKALYGDPALKLIQPVNRGTAPAIILSLLRIARQAPDALVAVLPSDHYFSDEGVFTSSLERAFHVAGMRRESVVLLGARPTGPDVDFGWIDLGAPVGENLFRARGFEEKPNLAVAERLFRSGALWNTFVMVGPVTAFLWMAFVSEPRLVAELDGWLPNSTEKSDLHVPAWLYDTIPVSDFSRQVLSRNAHRLLVLRLNKMDWHDLGHPNRVLSVVRSRRDEMPAWMYAWEAARMSAQGPLLQS